MDLKKKTYTYFSKAIGDYFKIRKASTNKYIAKLQYFSIYKHKKLNYYQAQFLNKIYNFSSGQILQKKSKRVKSFKKSVHSFGAIINLLNKKLNKKLNSIYLFYIKNFNLSTYLWVKKMFYLIKPKIYYTILTNSWNYIVKHKRRVKKKIFRNLFKQSKFV